MKQKKCCTFFLFHVGLSAVFSESADADIEKIAGEKRSDRCREPDQAEFGFLGLGAIIVGIVIGTAIFRSPTSVFQNVSGPWQALGAWLLGGVLCLIGALCYAELATTYPRNGGDYEYLSGRMGDGWGFSSVGRSLPWC